MSDQQNTIVFYRSWLEALEMIDGNESISYQFLQAIFDHNDGNEVTWDDPMLKLLWIQTIPLLDSTKKRREIARENGKLGGAPKGNQNARKQPKQPKTTKNKLDRDKDSDVDKDRDVSLDTERDKEKETRKPIGGVSIDTKSLSNDDRVETPQKLIEPILVTAFKKSIKKKLIQRKDVEDMCRVSAIRIVDNVLGRTYPHWYADCKRGLSAEMIINSSKNVHKNDQLIIDCINALCILENRLWGNTQYEHTTEEWI